MKVFWHQSDNFGDKLTPYVLDKLGIEYQYVDKGCQEEHYIFCGSILSACNEHSIIWGAGQAQYQDIVKPKEVLAVRGVYTRQMMIDQGIDCPEVYGDFAMVLPMIYFPKKEKKRNIGYIPHMADYRGDDHENKWDITRPVEETIDFILESDSVITSSFHAYMVARHYGIEAHMMESENVIGQRFKFNDYRDTEYDPNKFLSVCPFKERLFEYAASINKG